MVNREDIEKYSPYTFSKLIEDRVMELKKTNETLANELNDKLVMAMGGVKSNGEHIIDGSCVHWDTPEDYIEAGKILEKILYEYI